MAMIKPRYIEWENIGLCGLAGESGSGKTSTMRFVLAQLAMAGTGIILIDGHGKMTGGSQTLAQSCEPLSKSYIVPVAVNDNDIIDSIRLAATIAQNRIDGIDSSQEHVALVIDEIVSILDRLAFAGRQADIDYIVHVLEKFATEYRKTEVKAFIAAHNWTVDFIGSAALRRSMNTVILHRVSPEKVGYFTRNAIIKKSAPDLRVGQAYIIQAGSDPIKVYIPKITQDDLKAVAHVVPQIQVSDYIVPSEKNNDFQNISDERKATESDLSDFQSSDHATKIVSKWCSEILKMQQDGYTKTQILQVVFNVKPGATARYKSACKVYDYATRVKK